MSERVSIYVNRRLALATMALFGVLTIILIRDTASASNIGAALTNIVILMIAGPLFILSVRRAFQRTPVLIFSEDGLKSVDGHVIGWDKMGNLFLRQRQGIFGQYHHLVFTDRATDKDKDLPLDRLSVGWKDIVELVEHHVGRPVPVRREAGLRRP